MKALPAGVDRPSLALGRQLREAVREGQWLPGADVPIVSTVWTVHLMLSSATDPRLKTLVNTYRSGGQAPETRGPCTAGTGTLQG